MAESAEQIDFTWKGKDKQRKVITGEITAYSLTAGRAELRRQGIRIISIKKKPKSLFTKAKATITTKDISVFARQLATVDATKTAWLEQQFSIGYFARDIENPKPIPHPASIFW